MKRYYPIVLFFVLVVPLAGCATTAKELRKISEHKNTISLDQNYQAVFRNVLTVARDCLAGPINLVVSTKVEGHLYSELGYGEINHYQDNSSPIYHSYVKIAKVGNGSKITIYAAGSGFLKIFEEYVRGKKVC